MIAAPARRALRVHVRSVMELLIASAIPTLLSLWYWRSWVQGAAPPVDAFVPAVLMSPSLASALLLSEFLFVLAFLFGVLPMEWWLQTETVEGRKTLTPMMRAVRRARATMHAATAEAPAPDATRQEIEGTAPIETPAGGGEFAATEGPAQPAESVGAAPVAPSKQSNGKTAEQPSPAPGTAPAANASQPVTGDKQKTPEANGTQPAAAPPGTTQPAAAQSGAAQPDAAQPGTPQAQAPGQAPTQPPAADGAEQEEEATDLASLTDVSNILNDAFGDNDVIDPLLEGMSERLPDLDVYALLMFSQHIYREMTGKAQPPRRVLPPAQHRTVGKIKVTGSARAA